MERLLLSELTSRPGSAGDREQTGAGKSACVAGRPAQPEIAAFGEWNTTNLGDRAIHDEVLRFFAGCGWRTSSYGFGSLTPVLTNGARSGVSPAASRRTGSLLDIAPGIKGALRGLRQQYRMQGLLSRLSRVQAIAVGGGELLSSDASPHFPESLVLLAEGARLLGKPLFCLGCSAEGGWPGKSGRKIRKFLVACTTIAARDGATAARITDVVGRPIPVFGDFGLTEARMLTADRSPCLRQGYAINVCRLPAPWHAMQEQYEDSLVSLAGGLMRHAAARDPGMIRIFTTGTPHDTAPARRVSERLGAAGTELHLPGSLEQLADVLRSSVLVIASRLHGAVLALAEGTPVAGLSPTPKLHNFLSTMGLEEYSFDLDGGARFARQLDGTGYEALLAKQRAMLAQAPVWAVRGEIRGALESAALAFRLSCRPET